MTLAATLATAPLAAHHFGTVSLTAVPANLIALPAIAPAMWFGMLAGAVGQLPGAPAEPLTALGGLCAGYIGWVARAFGGEHAQLELAEPGMAVTVGITIGLLLAARLSCLAIARRSALRPVWRGRRVSAIAAAAIAAAGAGLLLIAIAGGGRPDSPADSGPAPDLVIRFLDVGQGDSILLQPRTAAPVLVDTGPPGGAVADRLRELGVDRLGAIAITHDELDHSGGLAEVLTALPVGRLIFAAGTPPAHCLSALCPPPRQLIAGDAIRAGRLRLDVLWPEEKAAAATDDPNRRSLVLRAAVGRFDALLTGDAEAELAPLDPGPIDLLKLAHHGSADPGLATLLARSSPQLAVISVGAGNGYGHPAHETLSALASRGIAIRRTDLDGEVVIAVTNGGWAVG